MNSFLISNGARYVKVSVTGRIEKVDEIEQATQFVSKQDADRIISRATKKLKGYKAYPTKRNAIDPFVGQEPNINRKIFSTEERNKVYAKNKGHCAICGKFVRFDKFTVDHIVPLARGGSNDIDNLQCACKQCNQLKQNMLPNELTKKIVKILLTQIIKDVQHVAKKATKLGQLLGYK